MSRPAHVRDLIGSVPIESQMHPPSWIFWGELWNLWEFRPSWLKLLRLFAACVDFFSSICLFYRRGKSMDAKKGKRDYSLQYSAGVILAQNARWTRLSMLPFWPVKGWGTVHGEGQGAVHLTPTLLSRYAYSLAPTLHSDQIQDGGLIWKCALTRQ